METLEKEAELINKRKEIGRKIQREIGKPVRPHLSGELASMVAKANERTSPNIGRRILERGEIKPAEVDATINFIVGNPVLKDDAKRRLISELEAYPKKLELYNSGVYKGSVKDLENKFNELNNAKARVAEYEAKNLPVKNKLDELNKALNEKELKIKELKPTIKYEPDPILKKLHSREARLEAIKNKLLRKNSKFTVKDLEMIPGVMEVPYTEMAKGYEGKGVEAGSILRRLDQTKKKITEYNMDKFANPEKYIQVNPKLTELHLLENEVKDIKSKISDLATIKTDAAGKLVETGSAGIGDYSGYIKDKAALENYDKVKDLLDKGKVRLNDYKNQSKGLSRELNTLRSAGASPIPPTGGAPVPPVPPRVPPISPSSAPLRHATSNVAGRRYGMLKAIGVVGALAGGAYLATKLLGNEGKRSETKVRIDPERYYVVCEDYPKAKIVGSRLGYVNRNGAEDMRESFINAGMYKDLRVNKGSTVIEKLGSVNFSHQYNFMNEETKEKLKTAGKVAATVGGLALAGLAGYNMYNAGSVGEGLSQTVGQLKGAAETAGKAIAKGAGYAAGKTVNAAKFVADKTVQGAKYAGNLAKRTGSYVANGAVKAGKYVKNSFNETVGSAKILGGSPVAAIPLASKLGVGKLASSTGTGGAAAAAASSAAAKEAAKNYANSQYNVQFSESDLGYEKSTEAYDKKVPTVAASVVGAGTGIVAWDQAKQHRLKRLSKLGADAHISDITKLNNNELHKLSGTELAELENKAYQKLGKDKFINSVGRKAAKLGRLGLGAGVTALAGLGAYKVADKISAMKENAEKAKYVPDYSKIDSDKYYVIDKATDSHFKVMKSFDDYESANDYKIRHKGIGPRGNLYVNRGSTLLDKRV